MILPKTFRETEKWLPYLRFAHRNATKSQKFEVWDKYKNLQHSVMTKETATIITRR